MSTLKQFALSVLATPLNMLAVLARLLKSGPLAPIMFAGLLFAAGLGGLWMNGTLAAWHEAVVEKTHQTMADFGLAVQEVTVSGRHNTRQADLIAAFDAPLGTPVFKVDIAQARTRLEALPWVKTAAVSRILPGKFHIELTERQPFARWQLEEGVFVIDREGAVITGSGLNRFSGLVTIQGENSNLHAAGFIDRLAAYPDLHRRMVALQRHGDRRWTLFLNHGGAVHLPADNVGKALDKLMELERDKSILDLKGYAIDLRLDDKMMLRPVTGKTFHDAEDNAI
ncbi:MAG: cell division protein FtsQ/DivIB [Parvibaculales bacterium]